MRDLLRYSARRSLAEALPHDQLRAGPEAPTRDAWAVAVTQGWTGLLVPEEYGGSALALADMVVLSEELGRALFPGPLVATAVLGATLATGHAALLTSIANGSIRIGVSWPDDLRGGLPVQPGPVNRNGALRGSLTLVEYPIDATHILLLDWDQAILVPASDLVVTEQQPFDITCPIGSVDCDGVRLGHCPTLTHDAIMIERAMAAAAVTIAAELVGVAAAALEMTISYVGERRQFGTTIGSFQAVKHRLADTYVLIENARSATAYAAAVEDARGRDRALALDTAASCAVEAALAATADAVQLHGAIGYAWDHDAHLYLKRARRLAANLGQPEAARARIAATLMQSLSHGAEFLFPPIAVLEETR
ncbi:MAG TPA: acyl-CoA dehydrogenase family protein [Aliidongia sp.]|uniref:acyl-CoA dehydrogenase family protein n=1 Tax=Aliidongia sp. TaxID=1914230 RepID=UPI002DDD485F|nr:acyl-CoA dehydrogenase family protein [Aliidongia sp.]HEV2673344.1 acyl-CoA dehydrogenase family protein [Aliidongia sp.]